MRKLFPSLLRKPLPHAAYLAIVFLLSLGCFTGFRILLLSLHQKDILHTDWERHRLVFQAFVIGLRFDVVIACYLLALPMVVCGLLAACGWLRPGLLKAAYGYAGTVFTAAFLLCAADIPFYNQFLRRLDDTALNWKGHAGFSLGMILQEPKYWLYFLVFMIAAALYNLALVRIGKAHLAALRQRHPKVRLYVAWKPALVLVLCCGLFALGMRGRLAAKTPILAGAASFCDDPTINALGLNAVFSFLRSCMDAAQPENQRLHWMDDAEALHTTAAMLGADPALANQSPIARRVVPAGALAGRNVVLVIMESMSTAKMCRYGCADTLTPFLDSLAAQGWAFDNIWSAGLHTYNGIYSTLFGHPALMKKHPMEVVAVPQMDGLPRMLRAEGYQTLFFTTHDELFDNMSGFLSANGFARIVGQKDYPAREVRSTMGVPDEFMFRYAVPVLSGLEQDRPFFAAFMTGSDHDPIVIPTETGFRTTQTEKYKQSAAYADWSLRKLMEYAARAPWYRNTLFVLVADHGCHWGDANRYDVVFSYQHIPLVMLAPGFTEPRAFPGLGMQTDVPATVMNLVGRRPYISNTLSTDLLGPRQKPYAIFSSDSRLACMSDSLLYVWRAGPEAHPSLYRYRSGDVTEYYAQDSALALPLRQAAFAWLQTSQWMIAQGKAGSINR